MSLINTTLVTDSLVSDQLETNLIYWLNYELLGTCAYYNISASTSGAYGGLASKLRLSDDPNFSSGRVWESFRKQWVWQSGVQCSFGQPVQISGVYVNNVFRPTSGTDAYSFKVDYPNGRIIFTSGISTSSTVKAEYSCNHYQVYNSDSPWWYDVQRNSFRVDDASFLITASGFWSRPPESRIQLPAVIVKATANMNKMPRQLGNLACYHEQDVKFFIIAETNRDLKWMVDTITNQSEATHECFDVNRMVASGVHPLSSDGSINNIGLNYPDLVSRYSWNRTWYFTKFRAWDAEDLTTKAGKPLFSAIINATVSTYL